MIVNSSLIATLGLVAAAALAAPAAAADLSGVPGVRSVSYSDLNLESADGRAQLERRLVRAAKSICATNPALESSAVRAERERCEAETAAQFDAQIASAIQSSRARKAAFASN